MMVKIFSSVCDCRINAEVGVVGQRKVPGEAGCARLRILHPNRAMWLWWQVSVQSSS